jgi:hypothetical protein
MRSSLHMLQKSLFYLTLFDGKTGIRHGVRRGVANCNAKNDVRTFGKQLQNVGQRQKGNVDIVCLK